jgi:nitrate reductase gamma subunit
MGFLGSVLPYLALAVFLAGMGWRAARWLQRPVPFSLALSPTEAGPGRQAALAAKELLLFLGLLRGDRWLWLAAWLMHASLALILVGHAVGIPCQTQQFCYLGASPETSRWFSHVLGMTAGTVFVVCLLTLACRRIAIPELRRLSEPGDYLILALLLAVAITGMWLRSIPGEAGLAAARSYLGSLVAFRPGPLPSSTPLVLHFTLVNVLLICFPFSKLAHLIGAIVGRMLLVRPAPRTEDRDMRTSRDLSRLNADCVAEKTL